MPWIDARDQPRQISSFSDGVVNRRSSAIDAHSEHLTNDGEIGQERLDPVAIFVGRRPNQRRLNPGQSWIAFYRTVHRIRVFDRDLIVHTCDEPLHAVIALSRDHVEQITLFEYVNHVCSMELSVSVDSAETQWTIQ